MNKHPTSSEVAAPLASTQPEDLQTALDDIAILTGKLDEKSEALKLVFEFLSEIDARLSKVEGHT